MFAFVTMVFTQFKVIIVGVALVGGTTAVVVVDQVVTPRVDHAEELQIGDLPGSDELLAELIEECAPVTALTDAELLALEAMTPAEAAAFFESRFEACEAANEAEEEVLSAEERAELLAELTDECGSADSAPTDADLAGLTEDAAEELFESRIEACEAANEAEEEIQPARPEDDEEDDEDEAEEADEAADESESGD